MKQEFSNRWISSVQARKQRKYRANAPLHKRAKMMASHLSEELRKKYKKRSFPVRKGDKVRVMRGGFKGTIGEIEEINRAKYKVYVKGVETKRGAARAIRYPLDASNLTVITLNTGDKKRVAALTRPTQSVPQKAKNSEIGGSDGKKTTPK